MTPFMKDLVIRRIGAWKFKRKKPKYIGVVGCPFAAGGFTFLKPLLKFDWPCQQFCHKVFKRITGCPCYCKDDTVVYTAFWRWVSGVNGQ